MENLISFKWRHFQKSIILLVVRWYLAYSLSYRDIEELMNERGIKVDHSTINRWVIHYSSLLENKFRKNYKRNVSRSWRMDETYVKIKSEWHYLYRALDKQGATVDFMLSKRRDEAAARAFFEKAIETNGLPDKVNIDKSGLNNAGLKAINLQHIIFYLLRFPVLQIIILQIKYLSNLVE